MAYHIDIFVVVHGTPNINTYLPHIQQMEGETEAYILRQFRKTITNQSLETISQTQAAWQETERTYTLGQNHTYFSLKR